MKDLLIEYQRSRDLLSRRLEELEAERRKVRGADALILEKRISVLKDEIFCMERVMDGIARNI